MHPADIQAALVKAGSSQSSIAQSMKHPDGKRLTQGSVHLVIRGKSKSARIAKRIAEVTGLTVSVMWPGAYPQLEQEERASHRAQTRNRYRQREAA